MPWLLGGCYAGLAGIVAGVLGLSNDGGTPEDLPPFVTRFRAVPDGSPRRILVEFELANDDAGSLAARLEYVELGEAGKAVTARAQATPAAGSAALEGLVAGSMNRFLWDAGRDLAGRAAHVELVVTPIEDGVPGRPFTSDPLRAGNTAVTIRAVDLSSRGEQVTVSFDLIDAEGDRIELEGLEVSTGPAAFERLPLSLIDRTEFPSAPGAGERASLRFLLDHDGLSPALRAAGRRGFVGEVCVRVTVRDFPEEVPAAAQGCFTLDNNEPPFVAFLPPLGEVTSGIVHLCAVLQPYRL
jgi:hypothetical protein